MTSDIENKKVSLVEYVQFLEKMNPDIILYLFAALFIANHLTTQWRLHQTTNQRRTRMITLLQTNLERWPKLCWGMFSNTPIDPDFEDSISEPYHINNFHRGLKELQFGFL